MNLCMVLNHKMMLLFIWLLMHMLLSCHCAHDLNINVPAVIVSKCCPPDELIIRDTDCQNVTVTDSFEWEPHFWDENNNPNIQVRFRIVHGLPNCGSQKPLPVYETMGSPDKLILLPNGYLRHYYRFDDSQEKLTNGTLPNGDPIYYDFAPNTYCLDKTVLEDKGSVKEIQAAILCVPKVVSPWTVDFIMRRVVNPVLHGIGIVCLLAVAIIYFIMPPLRDLAGNILSTIAVCLITSQTADLVRIFTNFSSHVSFMIADVLMYLSLLAAFFWLSSLGYFIWKIFRSRNVFLRVTDARKYCYYSTYAWGTTLTMTLVALASHFLFDDGRLPISPGEQKTIGWLGIALFFLPIACSILVDIFFYLSTARIISRMATYGRIHGRMKFSFDLFIQMFLVMSTAWFFLLLSWLQFDYLVYANIIVNALQGPLILIICVLSKKTVRALLRKGCCISEIETHWGEEMMSMTSNYPSN